MPEETRSQINEWITSATAGQIKDLLPMGYLHHGTPAMLANALYFKGVWERNFDAYLTRDETLFLHDGCVVRMPFMSSTSKQCITYRPGYKVVRLRYGHQGRGEHRVFSMYIYLPDAHDGLPTLLHKLSADLALLESSRTLTDEVPMRAFKVPRFTVAYKTNTREMLLNLGLLLPFDGDIVEVGAPEPLVVFDVYHESFVEVNEEGTEAASAIAVAMRFGCAHLEAPVGFVADHPFMFLIKEELSGVVVFAGQAIDPSIPQ
ncbi:unnamed protein product [Miscanthus lutarioriparius]|uniref:Serpin domain-containing protein n=1 Tax=Miscanthus lutarioriparius TaxID=422564 RepID=A0A811PC76_9POAL|nr:unnamed protein product [Miscanthus lutarioriparius]